MKQLITGETYTAYNVSRGCVKGKWYLRFDISDTPENIRCYSSNVNVPIENKDTVKIRKINWVTVKSAKTKDGFRNFYSVDCDVELYQGYQHIEEMEEFNKNDVPANVNEFFKGLEFHK